MCKIAKLNCLKPFGNLFKKPLIESELSQVENQTTIGSAESSSNLEMNPPRATNLQRGSPAKRISKHQASIINEIRNELQTKREETIEPISNKHIKMLPIVPKETIKSSNNNHVRVLPKVPEESIASTSNKHIIKVQPTKPARKIHFQFENPEKDSKMENVYSPVLSPRKRTRQMDNFGVNNFDFGEDNLHNLVEAYNKPNEELVIIEVTRHSGKFDYDIGPKEEGNLGEVIYENVTVTKEDIVIKNKKPLGFIQGETIRDSKGNVRIDRVGYAKLPVNTLQRKAKLSHLVEEIKQTERNYVETLGKIINYYMPKLQEETPSRVWEKSTCLFSNIVTLYSDAKLFSADLEQITHSEPDTIAKLFIKHSNMFKKYEIYLGNMPTANNHLKLFSKTADKLREDANDKLDFAVYIMTPFRILCNYKLLLERLQKEMQNNDKNTESVMKALEIIKTVMTKGNDDVILNSITNCPFSLREYSPVLLKDKFVCYTPEKMEFMMFLFERIIIFTYYNENNPEKFTYTDFIRMDDLTLITEKNKPFTFKLVDFTRSKNAGIHYSYIVNAESEEIKQNWIKGIEEKLWEQLMKAREEISHSVAYMKS